MTPSGNPFSWKEVVAILGGASAVIKILDWLNINLPGWLRRVSTIVLAGSVLFLVLKNSLSSPWSEILLLATGGVCGFELYRSLVAPRAGSKQPAGEFEQAAAYNGFGYEQIEFRLEVLEDRSGVLTRRDHYVAHRRIGQLYQYVFIPTAQRPNDALGGMDLKVIEKPTATTRVEPEQNRTNEGTIVYLAVTPPLEPAQTLEYRDC